MQQDIWHYPRVELANQVINLFAIGLSSALVFFSPRRMGKTEFLLKDVQPLAQQQGWETLYFSFLDAGSDPQQEFTVALIQFAEQMGLALKSLKLFKNIKKISGKFAGIEAGIEFQTHKEIQDGMKQTLAYLAKSKKILLLLDEMQVLAKQEANQQFIAALRTCFDMYKDSIKVIFTGSSQAGLRKMFSKADAPFFHFGQNLPFPEFDKGFTDHLADVFNKVTQRVLNKDTLWNVFIEFNRVPQLMRALVEQIALNPTASIQELKQQLLEELSEDREFLKIWESCSELERLILLEVSQHNHALFSQAMRNKMAKQLGVAELSVPSVQSAVRTLKRKELLGSLPGRQGYEFEDPNFARWVTAQ